MYTSSNSSLSINSTISLNQNSQTSSESGIKNEAFCDSKFSIPQPRLTTKEGCIKVQNGIKSIWEGTKAIANSSAHYVKKRCDEFDTRIKESKVGTKANEWSKNIYNNHSKKIELAAKVLAAPVAVASSIVGSVVVFAGMGIYCGSHVAKEAMIGAIGIDTAGNHGIRKGVHNARKGMVDLDKKLRPLYLCLSSKLSIDHSGTQTRRQSAAPTSHLPANDVKSTVAEQALIEPELNERAIM